MSQRLDCSAFVSQLAHLLGRSTRGHLLAPLGEGSLWLASLAGALRAGLGLGVLATAGCLFACSFSSSQNANLTVEAPKSFFYIANSNLAVEAPKLLFSSLQNTNLTVGAPKPSFYSAPPNLAVGAPKSPLHNSANAVMRMVVFLFQRAKR